MMVQRTFRKIKNNILRSGSGSAIPVNTASDLDPQPWFKLPCIKGLCHEFFFSFGLLCKLQAKIRTTGDLVYLKNFFLQTSAFLH
jgi:hypothetical protein